MKSVLGQQKSKTHARSLWDALITGKLHKNMLKKIPVVPTDNESLMKHESLIFSVFRNKKWKGRNWFFPTHFLDLGFCTMTQH